MVEPQAVMLVALLVLVEVFSFSFVLPLAPLLDAEVPLERFDRFNCSWGGEVEFPDSLLRAVDADLGDDIFTLVLDCRVRKGQLDAYF